MKRSSIHGKPIKDATEPLVIPISRRDIKGADRNSPTSCALARAIANCDEYSRGARVGRQVVLIEYAHVACRYSLKPEDTEKIRAFDYTGYFKPDEYELIPPKIKLGPATRNHKRKRASRAKIVQRQAPLRHAQRTKGKPKPEPGGKK